MKCVDDDDDDDCDTYVALIPRGFEHVVREIVSRHLHDEFRDRSAGWGNATDTDADDVLQVSTKILGDEILEDDTTSFVANVRTQLQNDMMKRRNRRCQSHRHSSSNDVAPPQTPQQVANNNPHRDTDTILIEKVNAVACGSTLVGTVEYTPIHQHVSIGYSHTNDNIWSTAGQMSGLVWMEIRIRYGNNNINNNTTTTNPNDNNDSNDRRIPCSVIANDIRCLGPILSVVSYYGNHNTMAVDLNEHQSVQEAGQQIASVLQNDPLYTKKFHFALQLWRKHVRDCWPRRQNNNNNNNGVVVGPQPITDDQTTPIKYRISCLRNDSKKYIYTRRDLLQYMDCIIPTAAAAAAVPLSDDDSTTTTTTTPTFTVDLTNYDLEIVLLYRPHCFLIGMAVRPYQYVTKSGRSFASGDLPPDITPPIVVMPTTTTTTTTTTIPQNRLVVRLRPSTAQILLHLANVQYGDIVLDPCAGIGTIPIEAHIRYHHQHRHGQTTTTTTPSNIFALGGDLIMNEPTMKTMAVEYLRTANTTVQELHSSSTSRNSTQSGNRVPDLLAWDATQLPIRSNSVDVIVSDLPFGQRCMSAVQLDAFVPLFVVEMARVLRRSTGRMVLLCGSYIPILKSLVYANECLLTNSDELIWELPCAAVFPVNIGGNLAWIVQVRRSCGRSKALPEQRDKIRKQVQKREHTEKMMQGGKVSKVKHPQS